MSAPRGAAAAAQHGQDAPHEPVFTGAVREKLEALFPRFNAEEAKVAAALSEEAQDDLASTLRTLVRGMEGSNGARS